MKTFLYFEETDGGMCVNEFTDSDFPRLDLNGWMTEFCKESDEALLAWCETAEIGDYYDHREGCMVRVKSPVKEDK